MQRSLFTAVSGLRNHQVKMDVIGNNIANVNTTAFKGGRVRFQDILSQNIRGASAPQLGRGGINPAQVGLGMSIGAIDTIHSQGSLQNTGRLTDLAIQGNGFFVMSDGTSQFYTRDGAFSVGADGELVNSANGFKPLGWAADAAGNINTTAPLGALNIPIGNRVNTRATENLVLGGNLNALPAIPATENLVFSGDLDASVPTPPPVNVVAYDSQGGTHTIDIEFTMTASNTWSWTATSGTHVMTAGSSGTLTFDASGNLINSIGGPIGFTPPGAAPLSIAPDFSGLTEVLSGGLDALDAIAGPPPVPPSHLAEVIAYDSQGGMHTIAITFTRTASNAWSWAATSGTHAMTGSSGTLTFDASGNLTASTGGPIGFSPSGVAALSIAPDFSGLTQVVGRSSALVRSQDGFPVGELESFMIGNTGVINGVYTNGLVVALGQVALAGFPNPEGLQKAAANMFQISSNSGQPRIGGAGLEGRGTIETATLEMSNVDLSVEFTEMITTSRAFQANSRMISASDDLLQEVVNLKR